ALGLQVQVAQPHPTSRVTELLGVSSPWSTDRVSEGPGGCLGPSLCLTTHRHESESRWPSHPWFVLGAHGVLVELSWAGARLPRPQCSPGPAASNETAFLLFLVLRHPLGHQPALDEVHAQRGVGVSLRRRATSHALGRSLRFDTP